MLYISRIKENYIDPLLNYREFNYFATATVGLTRIVATSILIELAAHYLLYAKNPKLTAVAIRLASLLLFIPRSLPTHKDEPSKV